MRFLKMVLFCSLISLFIMGCNNQEKCKYNYVLNEYNTFLERISSNKEMTDTEKYLEYSKLFQYIANGSPEETNDFAELVREITNYSVDFSDEEVFDLAKDAASLYSEIASGSAEWGIQRLSLCINHDGNDEITIECYGNVKYGVKNVYIGDYWHNNGRMVYNEEMGECIVEISLYDSTLTNNYRNKYHHTTTRELGDSCNGLGKKLMYKGNYAEDGGYKIYIGCDLPITAKEVTPTNLNRPKNTISVILNSPNST